MLSALKKHGVLRTGDWIRLVKLGTPRVNKLVNYGHRSISIHYPSPERQYLQDTLLVARPQQHFPQAGSDC